MRLVSLFEIVNQVLVVGMILGACGTALWLWTQGQVGAGAVAAVTAMALRVAGHAHWVMWEVTRLFESVGTIQDGINTLTRPRQVVDAPGAQPLRVTQGEVRFEQVRFAYQEGGRPVIDALLAAGVILDLLLGETPRWHPLVGFGKLANTIERRLAHIAPLLPALRAEYGSVAAFLSAEMSADDPETDAPQEELASVPIVDDDRSTRSTLRYTLQRDGFQVEEAADGVQALAMLKRFHPDVILMDAVMPVMDGFTACARLQELPGGSAIPVLMITALQDNSSVERAFAAGA
eukprot:gene33035-40773_t